jgi:hypothetical protein
MIVRVIENLNRNDTNWLKVMNFFNNAFINSDLPFKIDIVIWSRTSDQFKSIINQSHKVIQ